MECSLKLDPAADKWSGLKDRDRRYRQRHLDMIVNPDVEDFPQPIIYYCGDEEMLEMDGLQRLRRLF